MSANLNITQVSASQAGKTVTINEALGQLDAAMTEVATINCAALPVNIGAATVQSAACVDLINGTGVGAVNLPVMKRLYAVRNSSAFELDLTVGTTSFALAAGTTAIVYTDGSTNGLSMVAGGDTASGGSGGGSSDGPVAIVQKAFAIQNTAVLPAAPKVGNLIIAAITLNSTISLNPGWTLIVDQNNSGNIDTKFAYTTVTDATVTQYTPTNAASYVGIWEIANSSTADIISHGGQNVATGSGSLNAVAGLAGALVLALWDVRPSNTYPTLGTSWTNDGQGTDDSSNRSIIVGHRTASASSQSQDTTYNTNAQTDGCFAYIVMQTATSSDNGSGGGSGGTGANGAPGTPGSVWYTGAGAPSASTGISGDYYLNSGNYDIYRKVNAAWQLLGNIKGGKGDKGDTGATGAKGDAGQQGPQGLQGGAGAQGVQGPAGAAGSQWYYGNGAPAGTLGNNGDFYVDQTAFNLYARTAGAWALLGAMKGADGAPGTPGAAGTNGTNGADGAKGDTGAQGVPGAKGDTGATGVGVPTGGTTGQVLTKSSAADFATAWTTPASGGAVNPFGDANTDALTMFMADVLAVPFGFNYTHCDTFATSTNDVDTSKSVGTTYSATNKNYAQTAGTFTVVSGTAYAIASSQNTSGYQATKAFDLDTTTTWGSTVNGNANQWIGQDFGAGNAKSIRRFGVTSATNAGSTFSSGSLEYSDDNSTWTTALAVTTLPTSSQGSISYDVPECGPHRYWRLRATSTPTNASYAVSLNELTMFVLPVNTNFSLQSKSYALAAAPTIGQLTVQMEYGSAYKTLTDSLVLNTEICAYLSRDGGTTFTQVTLSRGQVLSNNTQLFTTGDVDLTTIATGTNLVWKVTLPTTKAVAVSGVMAKAR